MFDEKLEEGAIIEKLEQKVISEKLEQESKQKKKLKKKIIVVSYKKLEERTRIEKL